MTMADRKKKTTIIPDALTMLADTYVASRHSKQAILTKIAESGVRFLHQVENRNQIEEACNAYSFEVGNELNEINRHDHYMGCAKRSMSILMGNDMAEVLSMVSSAERRRRQGEQPK